MSAATGRAQTAHGTRGIVVTGHTLATSAALDVLRDGGNAVDAAVAAAFVLAVVAPYACTLGGDLYMLVRDPRQAETAGLNATGASPFAATPERFAEGMPANGVLSATVPGFVRGLADAHHRFGRHDFATLVEPARRHAADGIVVHPVFAANTAERAKLLAGDPAASALFLPGGEPLAAGTHFVQSELAEVLGTIASDDGASFYEGRLAKQIVDASHRAGGLFDDDDLGAHASLWQKPIAAPFYGHEVVTMPPNSYGATLLFQLLELEAGGIDSVDPASAEFIERGYAARRNAYKVAGPFIADPAKVDEHLRAILAAAVAGDGPGGAAAMPPEARDRCTTCAVIIDGDGMAVSLIASVSAPYGAGVVLAGTGILLNNRMAGFNTTPGHANVVAPSKRPANTLAPCLVTKDGALAISVGTPGTVGQTCTLAQFLARVLAIGQDPAAAIDAPRWSVDFSGKLVVEEPTDPAIREAVGAKAMRTGWISFGSIKAAIVTGDRLVGIADYRRAATTEGW